MRLLLVLGMLCACTPPAPRAPVVAVVGDSLTRGAWSSSVADRLGVDVTLDGVGGRTCFDLPAPPDDANIIVVMCGTNGTYPHGVYAPEHLGALAEYLDGLRDRRVAVLALPGPADGSGPVWVEAHARWNEGVRELARSRRWVEVLPLDALVPGHRFRDHVHLDTHGDEIVATTVATWLMWRVGL